MDGVIPFPFELPWTAPRIAVLEISGTIGMAVRGPEVVRTVNALAEDARVRAVVVEIDSPGGSAPVSDAIYRSLRKLTERKPTIASVLGLGLSGGYMIACGASKIVALPSSLVGSIGVIFMRPVIQELMQRVGVKMVVTREGRLKDMMQPFREPTPEEQEKMQALTEEYYARFIEKVAEARRLDPEVVREYATGEVFSGEKAKEMGLIDELGDMDTALDMASELGRVPRRLQYVRPRRPLLERIISRGGASLAQTVLAEMEVWTRPRVEYR